MIALYARVSGDAQVEAGLPSQLAASRRYIREKYADEPVIELIDDGYTGATMERPKFDELRGLMRAGGVSVVVAYDPDRLSRDAADLAGMIKEFDRYRVMLDFVQGGRVERTPSGRMTLQMRGVMAEYERMQILARTLRGRLESARRGRIFGGPVPIGLHAGRRRIADRRS